MTFSSSHYLTANVPYIHPLPEFKHHLTSQCPRKQNPRFLACCILSEILPQFDFGDYSHHPLETGTSTILNGPINRNSVDLNRVSMEARRLMHLYLPTDQETFDSGTCRQWNWSVWEHYHAWSAVLHEWSVARWPRTQTCFSKRAL
jgi:hypothetical protein